MAHIHRIGQVLDVDIVNKTGSDITLKGVNLEHVGGVFNETLPGGATANLDGTPWHVMTQNNALFENINNGSIVLKTAGVELTMAESRELIQPVSLHLVKQWVAANFVAKV